MANVGFESVLSNWTVGKAILASFGLLTFYVVGSIFYNLFLHPLRKYPGPKLWAISRLPWNWVNLHGRLAWRLRELHQQYGPVVRIAPDELSYTTSGAWKKIYGQRSPEFSKALDGRGLAPPSINGIKGIVTEDQDRHARLRRAIAPAFSERALRDQEGYLQAHTDNLMNQLKKRCYEGPQDVVKWFSLTTFDVISDLAFGQPAGCLNNADQPWLQVIGTRAKSIVWFQLAIYYGFFNFMNWMAPKYTVQARQKHIELTSAKVQQRIEQKNPGKDFMSYILENKTENLSNLELVIMASSFIVAGSGTGASCLSATTNFLLRNPDKMQRLVDEVRSAFASDDEITMQSTSALKYLTACIDESMRLYPPAPSTLPRFVPPGGDEIDGRWVPAGTAVGVHQFSTGHMAWNFARASEFIPERWLDLPPGSEFANDDRAAIQPFSYGPRNCIGKNNVLTIVPAVLLALLVVNLVDRVVRRLRIARKAKARGCLPVPVEPTKWPLGIDMVLAGLRADREQRTPDFIVARFNAMGPRYTWRLRILGTENFITAEPKNVQAVLATQFGDFIMGAARRTNLKRVLGRSIFAVDGAAWHAAREVVRPIFSRENVSDLALLEQHFRLMLQCMPIDEKSGWTAPVNLAALFPSLTIDSSTELFLGKSTHSLLSKLRGREEENNFHGAFERVQQLLGIRMRLRSFYWLYGNSELEQCITILHAFVDKAMSEARAAKRDNKASSKRYDFLNTLVERCSDVAEVREHVLGLLAAGRDTTASLMSWTFYCLIRNRRVFDKLRGVVHETFGPYREEQDSITFEKLKGCSYLQHVMNETLRLHSIVPFNSRCAVRDTTLPTGGGPDGTAPVFVPAGTEVNFSTHVMHRRHDLWGPDADEFVPERWEKRRPGWTYAPFNEAGYVITRMLQRFEAIEGLDVDPSRDYHNFTVVCAPGPRQEGVKARLKVARE
ncbi:cytochrome P450 71A23 [Phyllosticta citricarpa]|uniref:Cytochrome P450 71A23 n=1 Tax=Phyllosticta citricarpa TaxID=55181 RepID=A0ABR1MDG9_9PEZI